jgi:hypothetical protein
MEVSGLGGISFWLFTLRVGRSWVSMQPKGEGVERY